MSPLANRSAILGLFFVSVLAIPVVLAYPKSHVLWFEVGPAIRNCRDVQRQGNDTSGLHTIFPYNCCPERPVQVYCDMETDGGGWTIIQRRDDIEPRQDFYRTWIEYSLGFGDLKGEFWLGLDHIHALTDQMLNELRFDLGDFDNNTRWAGYKSFYVHDKSSFYKMEVTGFSGDAGDSFIGHTGHKFTTKDNDQDTSGSSNCAVGYKGGWWYNACHGSNLNGLYLSGKHSSYADGINWTGWKGHHYSLKKTEIKIRPAF